MQAEAVELSFDIASESRLALTWEKLGREYVRCGTAELGIRPHVSLAVFRDGTPPNLERTCSALAAEIQPFVLDFVRVAAFRTSEGVVFLEPAVSLRLNDAHSRLMALLGPGRSLVQPYYREGAWVPHCTVAIGVPEDMIDQVMRACRLLNALGPVTVSRVSAIQYRPTTELFVAEIRETSSRAGSA